MRDWRALEVRLELWRPCRRPDARILRMSEAIFWILDAPGETFGQHILDFGGLRGASGSFWKPFWRRFGVQDRWNMEISDILESMLSPAWEHGFSMFWAWIWDGF